jgi:hypothetical protein
MYGSHMSENEDSAKIAGLQAQVAELTHMLASATKEIDRLKDLVKPGRLIDDEEIKTMAETWFDFYCKDNLENARK